MTGESQSIGTSHGETSLHSSPTPTDAATGASPNAKMWRKPKRSIHHTIQMLEGHRFREPITNMIVEFLTQIGMLVQAASIQGETILPGITISQGVLLVDESTLKYPGDLLHEAGHLAVMSPARRRQCDADVGQKAAEEISAIAWSFAAAIHLQLEPAVVFHQDGYRDGSASLIENFSQGRYVGVPMLQWLGMTFDEANAAQHGVAPFPHMINWLNDQECA